MSRGRQHFRQSDLAKAIKAVVAAGLPVARVEVSPEGRLIVIAGKPGEGQDAGTEVNEWDAVK
ncbi:hypothetical protein [Bradyrhizobium sp. Arg816]|uniref:hypothetical protein n=1 Tax=Bradyrhizobium sp. Arg816 TaxID=2998491 RepID=UPI00249F756F|nr:hypothetical protein [Bradyrhizobium sp. Arg816]MDI3561280.1 hypothetical protein [Bradyrhizobium sp. Arg816]